LKVNLLNILRWKVKVTLNGMNVKLLANFLADPFRRNPVGVLVSSTPCIEIFGIKLATTSTLRNNATLESLKAGIWKMWHIYYILIYMNNRLFRIRIMKKIPNIALSVRVLFS
jgi:hypothetical protein